MIADLASGSIRPSASSPSTLIEVLRDNAARIPDREAFRFLLDGEDKFVCWTYKELDRRARALAVSLGEVSRRGDRVVMLYPPGLEFISGFFGCLYQGVIAVPAYPPTSQKSLPRLLSIVKDARPSVILTTAKNLAEASTLRGRIPELDQAHWLAIDSLDDPQQSYRADAWQDPGVDSETVAFLQYTSGSTSTPKGVEVSHGNLLHNERMIQRACDHNDKLVMVGWLPLYHDMGLIGNVLQPPFVGGRCVLMSPLAFLQRPIRWLKAISRYGGITSGGPNFAYELCLRKIPAEERQTLNLASWSVAFNGAEPVRSATLERFAQTFADCGFRREAFYPCYGMAEATLFVSGNPRLSNPKIVTVDKEELAQHRVAPVEPGEGSQSLVGCGVAWLRQKIRIVDPESRRPCSSNVVGEIWVSGPSVARGYWNRPEETERTFWARTADGEGPFLRTGDLGFLSPESGLVVTGRIKDLIILRGRNYYPQDLELASETSHPALRPGCSAAFSVDLDDQERLVIVQEVDRRYQGDLAPLAAAIRQAVAEEHQAHVHAVVLIRGGSISKTSSGKIQRRRTRQLFLAGDLQELDSSIAIETTPELSEAGLDFHRDELLGLNVEERREALGSYLKQRLSRIAKVPREKIDSKAPLTAVGLDSLMAVELKNRVQAEVGVSFDLAEVLRGPRLDELAGQLAEALDAGRRTPSGVDKLPYTNDPTSGPFPLSFGQRAMWFLQKLAPESAAYNIVAALRIRESLDIDRLDRALVFLTQRHPSLRTAIRATSEGPRQEVLPQRRIELTVEDVASRRPSDVEALVVERANTPFDLERDSLMRVHVLRCDEHEQVLVWVIHHIIADLWSLGILLRELRRLYSLPGERLASALLPPLGVTYADYVGWQKEIEGPAGDRLWTYWHERLGGELPVLAVPADRPRPPHQTFRGAACGTMFSSEVGARVRALSERSGATLFTVLLATFQVLLARICAQSDILVGTPASGRNRAELTDLLGYFVNPVVMRADLSGQPSFEEHLSQTWEVVIEALAHQDFPFPLLVERLQPERDTSRSPIFQAMFALQQSELLSEADLLAFVLGRGGVELDFAGLAAESLPFAQRIAQFDLELIAAEIGERLGLTLFYNTDLFDATTATRILESFRILLEAALESPRGRVAELLATSEGERQMLLCEWNDTAVERAVATERLYLQRFEEQAARSQEAVALVCGTETLSYRELVRRARFTSESLIEAGVGPETRVAVLCERSPRLAVAILGILRAGAVYVPLDPHHPESRIGQILERSQSRLLLVTEDFRQRVGPSFSEAPRTLSLESLTAARDRLSSRPPAALATDQLAYVIYTSGTTGIPKGAMVAHGGMLNHLEAKIGDLGITSSDTVAQNSSQTFDISVWQFLAALLVGGRVHIFPDEVAHDPAGLLEQVEATDITVFETVPSMLRAMLAQEDLAHSKSVDFAALRWLVPTGEALPPELCRHWLEKRRRIPLVNAYGPTECSDDVTHAFLREPPRPGVVSLPIGRPIRGSRLYVLDRRLGVLPRGVPGELLVAGRCVGRGYLHAPRQSAASFRPDPFAAAAGGRLYKTGDLVRYLSDGQLEFLGRIDHQVKVRGFRVELGEIESVLLRHPSVREAVVLARQDLLDNARLIAYWVASPAGRPEGALREWVASTLPEYMVPSAFIELEALPLTANGKLDRTALPEPSAGDLTSAAHLVAPRTPTEEILAGFWADVLGLGRVGVTQDFFGLGGHSLLATRVVSRVRETFGVDVPLRSFFEQPTVAGLAASLETGRRSAGAAPPLILAADPPRVPQASFQQRRMWFLNRLDPQSSAYNMPGKVHLVGELDVEVLERSLSEVALRHETLRTTFDELEGEPVPIIAARPMHRLARVDLGALSETERPIRELVAREVARPFDLAAGPLLRLVVFHLSERHHLLLVNLHHAISDGWSQAVLVREVSLAYDAFLRGARPSLPELSVHYRDYAFWQHQWLAGAACEAQLTYWREQLRDAEASVELPADHPRPPRWTYRGRRHAVELPVGLSSALRALAQQEGATLFMTLLAAWGALLYRLSAQRDLSVGTPIANRNQPASEALIGLFVNTLVLRLDLAGNPRFRELTAQVREVALGAYSHQDLPFERLVDALQPKRDLSRNPLFQTMFVLQNAPFEPLVLRGLKLTAEEADNGTAKFDLTLSLEEVEGRLRGWLEYATDIYTLTTVQRLFDSLRQLLKGAVADPASRLSQLPLLSAASRHQISMDWNNFLPPTAPAMPIHKWFERQAKRIPEAVAVAMPSRALTYRELDLEADRWAHRLRALGVGPEIPVAILSERRPELLAGLYGILKAGGAYVPIDPAYPAERQAFMLRDSGAEALLTWQDKIPADLPEGLKTVTFDGGARIRAEAPQRPCRTVPPGAIAYMIYTSGSTGVPKAVAIEHRHASALLRWAGDFFTAEDLACSLAATSVCFDVSVFEFFAPLAHGGKVLLVENILALSDLDGADQITMLCAVPSAMPEVLRRGPLPPKLRTISMGGEPLRRELAQEICRKSRVEYLRNLYGPSEDTTYSTSTRISPDARGEPTIGRPIDTGETYVLARGLTPVPIGAIAGLYLGGAGIARGYAGRPALTAERFLPHPFSRSPEDRLYHTGDLARYRADGELEFLGRSDRQIKIRGFRIELEEIEAALLAAPSIEEGAVVYNEIGGDVGLAAYIVFQAEPVALSELAAWLRDKLPGYMVPAVFVPLEKLPRTPNGKLDRRALPEPERSRDPLGKPFAPPRNAREKELALIWSELLGLDRVGVDDDFFGLGGHSLLVTRLLVRLERAFEVDLTLPSLFEASTVAAQAELIAAARSAPRVESAPIVAVERPPDLKKGLPLSYAQERLWIMDRMSPGSPIYNVGQALRVEGPLEVGLLRRSFELLVAQHEILRTRFQVVDGAPRQVISRRSELDWREIDLGEVPREQRESRLRELADAEAKRPFDLSEDPLLRVRLFVFGAEESTLLLTLHHIVCDDWSIGLMTRQIAALYRSLVEGDEASAPAPRIQYADFAAWQRKELSGEVLEKKLDYWRQHLAGPLPVLELPTSRPRPVVQSFWGAVRSFSLSPELTADLRERVREQGMTLFMALLSAFSAVLYRCSGQSDMIVGCPEANRNRLETEGLIGVFVNILPLRIDLSGDPSYRTLLERVRATALDGFDHADVPFEKIVDTVNVERDLSRAAVRQVGLAFENHAINPMELAGGVRCEPVRIDTGASRLDLTLFLWNRAETLAGLCEYNTDLFDASAIDRFLDSFQLLLAEMTEDPDRPIADLPPMVEAPVTAAPAAGAGASLLGSPRLRHDSNLTENQLLFWFAHQLNPDTELYFDRAMATFRIAGAIDPRHFERAFRQLVKNADALRTTIHTEQGVPQRVVASDLPTTVELVDLSKSPDPESALRAWLSERSSTRPAFSLRLFDTALIQLAPEVSVWFWCVYHIIADAWSLAQTARILSEYYRRSLEGTLEKAPALASFELFVDHEQKNRRHPRYEKARRYWEEKLSRPLEPNLFYLKPTLERTTHTFRLSAELGQEKSRRLQKFTSSESLFSPAVPLMTVLFVFMHRINGGRVLRLGTPFANRRPPFAEIIGLEMNACPLQVEIAGTESFRSLTRKVQRETVETGRFQFFPIPNPADQPAWDVYFNYQNISFTELCGLPVEFSLLDSGHSNDIVDLQVRDFTASGSFVLDFDFNREAFTEEEGAASIHHYLRLLDAMLDDAGTSVHQAEMLTRAERALLLDDLNDTGKRYPQNRRLEELFAEQVQRSSNEIALVDENEELTYRELDGRADQVARRLRRLGVGPGAFVGIAVERSAALVVGLLGILKAGGAYVPLDPNYPSERLTFMMEDSRVSVLLTQESLLGSLRTRAKSICLDRDAAEIVKERNGAPAVAASDMDLAYMIYTSGSTGRPKGVMISHRGIVNRLFWMQDAYGLSKEDRVLQKTPMSFDVSVWEFFWPLLFGARLVMARPDGHRDPDYLLKTIADFGITTLHFVPSMLQVFLAQKDLRSYCGSLRRVITSGEALPEDLRRRFFEEIGTRANPELHNLYGPTEASVDVTAWSCPRENNLGTVPIGRPIANTQMYILDRYAQTIPLGIAGELHIGGVNLARGYLRRPALTAEKFVPHIASAEAGDRLYRTGDLARYLRNGDIEFLGRLDHQVKVRGFRVELGEIETVLAQHRGVREVVVLDWQDALANTHLVAYIVGANGSVPAAELRDTASLKLPDYMVPSAWVFLDELPLTPSGKVDRKSLPEPDREAQTAGANAHVEPRTPLEALLASVFAEVLDLDEISIEASFFDLGGNSLMATQVVTLMQDILPVEVTVRNIFGAPTVAAIAAQIEEERRKLSAEDTSLMEEVLSEFVRMSMEEEELVHQP